MGRRDEVLDAAIAVVAGQGMRALTHRAVDRQAGLPPGATSNVCRTRARLVQGVLERILESEFAVFTDLGPTAEGIEGLSDTLAALVHELSTTHRTLTLARHCVVTEAAMDTETLSTFTAGRERVADWAQEQLATIGSHSTHADGRTLLALLDGLLAEALTPDDRPLDTRRAFRAMLEGLLRPAT